MEATLKQQKIPILSEDEMRQSFMDYAMSVIISRALPDVRDGLKPVHRRVLYAMYDMGNTWDKPYKKSARLVGDVIGKYHPPWRCRGLRCDRPVGASFLDALSAHRWPGNFGSISPDPPAAMRYTEIRMARLAEELLGGYRKKRPSISFRTTTTPSKNRRFCRRAFPICGQRRLGIAVGMATNILRTISGK